MIASQIWVQVGDWYEPEFATGLPELIVQRRHDAGEQVCSVGFGDGPLGGDTEPNVFVAIRPEHTEDLKECDDVVLSGFGSGPAVDARRAGPSATRTS